MMSNICLDVPWQTLRKKMKTHQRSHRDADGKGKRMPWIIHIGKWTGKELREELGDIQKIRISAWRSCSLPKGAFLQLTCGCDHSHAPPRYTRSKFCVSAIAVCLRRASFLGECQWELYRNSRKRQVYYSSQPANTHVACTHMGTNSRMNLLF